jgi:hypothetical protein
LNKQPTGLGPRYQIRKNEYFCGKIGTKQEYFEERTMFCSKCGTKIEEKDKFCPKCGYSIDSLLSSQKEEDDNKKMTVAPPVPAQNRGCLSCLSGFFAVLALFAFTSVIIYAGSTKIVRLN